MKEVEQLQKIKERVDAKEAKHASDLSLLAEMEEIAVD